MPKIINYTLSIEELQQVEQAIRGHQDLRVRQRATMIRILHLGKTPQETAVLLSTTAATVYSWHKRWREDGLAGLETKPRPGRPKVGGNAYKEQLETVLEQEPRELGYGFNVWTVERLLAHLEKETKIRVCEKTLCNRLEELAYGYRRPKHDLTNLQDKTAKEQVKGVLEELKKERKQEKSNYSLWTKQP